MNDPRPTQILAIAHGMTSEAGHVFAYHKALNEAANSLGWHYTVAAPKHHSIPHWPAHWHSCLKIIDPPFLPRVIAKLHATYQFQFSLSKFLKQYVEPQKHSIIFVEHFAATRYLKILMGALPWRQRSHLSLWLMLRHEPANLARKGKAHRRWFHILRWLVGRDRFFLVTDSEPLANKWRSFLDMPVHLLPFPLTTEPLPAISQKNTEKLLCWWPGRPDPSKGSTILESLLNSKDPLTDRLKFIFAETTPLKLPENQDRYLRLPGILPRENYLHWMASADIILLPYAPVTYASNTSAIFIEAIVHGKLPITTAGTSMAQELCKYGLEDLVVDWAAPDIIARILALSQDDNLKAKLKAMQSHYQQYHSVGGFAQAMLQLHALKESSL